MTETPSYGHLTLLGKHFDPTCQSRRRRAGARGQPRRRQALHRAVDMSGVHIALSSDRTAGLCSHYDRLYSQKLDRRKQILQIAHGIISKPRRLPRGLHHGNRREISQPSGSRMVAHRRLLVSQRRHSYRCVLAIQCSAVRRLGAGAGRAPLSRAWLEHGRAERNVQSRESAIQQKHSNAEHRDAYNRHWQPRGQRSLG